MAEWNFRIRVKSKDKVAKDWATWDAEHPYVDHPRDKDIAGMQSDARGHEVDLHHQIPWQPTMGVAQANAYTAGTVLPGPFYHGTISNKAADAIRNEGFSQSHIGEGSGNRGVTGAGFYLSSSRDYAGIYAGYNDDNTFETRILAKNPMPMNELREFLGGSRIAPGRADEITAYARSKGYDSIHVVYGDNPTNQIDEVVVFDPQQIVVVSQDA